jgi:hypothetical protein
LTASSHGSPTPTPTPTGEAAGGADIAPRGGALKWLLDGSLAAWLASAIVHGGLLLIISVLIIARPGNHLMWIEEEGAPLEEMTLEELPDDEFDDEPVPRELGAASLGSVTAGNEIELPGPLASTVGNVRIGPANAGVMADDSLAAVNVDPFNVSGEIGGGEFGSALDVLTNPLATRGGGLEGRKFENRLEAALAGGGTRQSEEAVEMGLNWLAKHQFADGGWRFNLEEHPDCDGACRDSGSYDSTTSATGLALLCFLGAGYTHEEGKYQEVVAEGLEYLRGKMQRTSVGGDLRDNGNSAFGLIESFNRPLRLDDTMYSHGIATLALTEAYAMTNDSSLRDSAEQATRFIVNAQYEDGGWRYAPAGESNGPGDMTVTGWQLMALKSAVLGGIEVPNNVWSQASAFIDTLEIDDGARFTYVVGNRATAATTAIGILARMIGGAPRESRSLLRGVARIGAQKPYENNVYFIYYASQVLHHLGGKFWTKWNAPMREYLIDTQATDGHEEGSWYFLESHSGPGGRLYTTTMAIMTLEVYYRYMPLYGESFVEKTPQE